MKTLSEKLKDYPGGNPFRESQAKTYGADKIVDEFYPTSFYWSLFNEQHEILLGTRGSGKTVLLRMLTYSLLKRCHDVEVKKLALEKKFIGFYVPLHLEFMELLRSNKVTEPEKIEYFQFAFNCSAAKSFLIQVYELLIDCFSEKEQRFMAESKIVDHLTTIWFPSHDLTISSIRDLKWKITVLFNSCDFPNTPKEDTPIFSRPLLTPITAILPKVTEDLALDTERTNWIICIDEAEFLDDSFIKCINTFMRSEKRPLIIKMATLPFKHSTRETLRNGILIEPNGSDFNYRKLDMEWDSHDFIGLTNHLCKVRLMKCGIDAENLTLETFLGVEGKDEPFDYFKTELPKEAATSTSILQGILDSLSEKRKDHYSEVQKDINKAKRPVFNRFAPVYYVRKMKAEDSKGNRKVGWFAGPSMVRRVADGNPRRFIQIMNDMVEKARKQTLTPKNQHIVLKEFATKEHDNCEALPKYGLLTKKIISEIGNLLSERVHGTPMRDGGCSFYLDPKIIENSLLKQSVELAIAYSHIFADQESLFTNITKNSKLRLAYLHAVYFWLPMRKGESPVMKYAGDLLNFSFNAPEEVPTTPKEAETFFYQLNLKMDD